MPAVLLSPAEGLDRLARHDLSLARSDGVLDDGTEWIDLVLEPNANVARLSRAGSGAEARN